VQAGVVVGRRLLGVRDPVPGGHQVELAGPDHLLAAEAVAVQHVPGDQPGDRLEPDVRVRRDLHPGHAVHRHRAVVIHKAPRAHAAALAQREQPPHLDVAHAREPGAGQLGVAGRRVALTDRRARVSTSASTVLMTSCS
jgi:hypothetical protein